MIVATIKPQIPPKTGSFTLNLRAQSVPTRYRNSEYWTWLTDMKVFFERIITSNRTLNVDIRFESLSGSILAQCGPGDGTFDILAYLSDIDLYNDGTARPNHATMAFNTNYYKEPPVTSEDEAWKRQFFTTALHECFHGVGLGSMWNGPFRILVDNSWSPTLPPWLGGGQSVPDWLLSDVFNYNIIGTGNPSNPRYNQRPRGNSSYALAEYRSQMSGQSGASNIPIENFTGTKILGPHTPMADAGGTALAHWRGSYYGTPSGIVNEKGQDHIDENFTSWSSRYEGLRRWVSRYTIGALRDIGYLVNYSPLEIALNDWKTV